MSFNTIAQKLRFWKVWVFLQRSILNLLLYLESEDHQLRILFRNWRKLHHMHGEDKIITTPLSFWPWHSFSAKCWFQSCLSTCWIRRRLCFRICTDCCTLGQTEREQEWNFPFMHVWAGEVSYLFCFALIFFSSCICSEMGITRVWLSEKPGWKWVGKNRRRASEYQFSLRLGGNK